jgi:hypothetical protein
MLRYIAKSALGGEGINSHIAVNDNNDVVEVHQVASDDHKLHYFCAKLTPQSISFQKPPAQRHRLFVALTKNHLTQKILPMSLRYISSLHRIAVYVLFVMAALPALCSIPDKDTSNNQAPFLLIKSPAPRSIETKKTVRIAIDLDRDAKTKTLRFTLNGNDITKKVSLDSCNAQKCKMTGEIEEADGLREGPNRLHAGVEGKNGRVDVTRSDFRYHSPDKKASALAATAAIAPAAATPTAATLEYYTPDSVGLTIAPNGGGPGGAWVTITTGQTAGVSDPVASFPALPNPQEPSEYLPSEISNSDVTFSLASDCTGIYQAIVLQRTDPAIEEAAACGNTEPDVEANLNTTLGRSLDSSDLVIFGTTPGQFADPSLNTSDLGGTNYLLLPSGSPLFPQYYIIVGVPGATPGTARENYLPAPTTQTPYTYYPTLNGTLTTDQTGNYNLTLSAEKDFTVISSPTNASMVFQYGAQWLGNAGTQTYTPPQGAANVFWLIVFDRMAMQPIPVNAFSGATQSVDCGYTQTAAQCGMLFNVQADGGVALANVLNSVSPRNLIVLTTIGCPFSGTTQISSSLGNVLQSIGGMQYTLNSLVSSNSPQTCNYSLISVNDQNHEWYNTKAAVSSNIFSSQGQLGALHGYLGVDQTGLYDVAAKDQMIMQDNVLTPVTNYTMEHIASQQRADWQFADTSGHLASYHDVSYQLLAPAPPQGAGETGANLYDIRSFYTLGNTGVASKIASLAPQALALSQSGNPSSWDTQAEDFRSVAYQIYVELNQLNNSLLYLTGGNGSGGVRAELNGVNASVFNQVATIAGDVSKDWSVAEQENVNANGAQWMNLGSGISGLLGPILSAAGGPEVGVFMGVVSSALKTGSAAWTLSGSTAIPSPEAKYISTLNELASDASTYNSYLIDQYDGAILDDTLTDYWKFYQVGYLESDTSSGWNLGNFEQGDSIATVFQTSERTSLWNDILPQLYGARTAPSQTSPNPATYGSYILQSNILVCLSAYPNVSATSMTANHHIGDGISNLWDVNILAEGKAPPSGNNIDTPVSGDLTNMLTTNQAVPGTGGDQTGLNIPPMMLINNGPWTYSEYKLFSTAPNDACNALTAPPIVP